ncbi:MAG: hypothetical protein WD404_06585 [Solirubrobacterales bacterium]
MAAELRTEGKVDPADLTFERFKAALGGDGRYPQGAIFVDAEAPFAGSALVRNAREGLPVVLVYPDGVEKIIEAASPVEQTAGLLASARRLAGKVRASRLLG